jgi:hypothetical protein
VSPTSPASSLYPVLPASPSYSVAPGYVAPDLHTSCPPPPPNTPYPSHPLPPSTSGSFTPTLCSCESPATFPSCPLSSPSIPTNVQPPPSRPALTSCPPPFKNMLTSCPTLPPSVPTAPAVQRPLSSQRTPVQQPPLFYTCLLLTRTRSTPHHTHLQPPFDILPLVQRFPTPNGRENPRLHRNK